MGIRILSLAPSEHHQMWPWRPSALLGLSNAAFLLWMRIPKFQTIASPPHPTQITVRHAISLKPVYFPFSLCRLLRDERGWSATTVSQNISSPLVSSGRVHTPVPLLMSLNNMKSSLSVDPHLKESG